MIIPHDLWMISRMIRHMISPKLETNLKNHPTPPHPYHSTPTLPHPYPTVKLYVRTVYALHHPYLCIAVVNGLMDDYTPGGGHNK